jgi:hypothetical protein
VSVFKVMTAETLAKHKRAAIPAECECGIKIEEGQQYTGGGLMMCCATCTKLAVATGVDDAKEAYQTATNHLLMVCREIVAHEAQAGAAGEGEPS